MTAALFILSVRVTSCLVNGLMANGQRRGHKDSACNVTLLAKTKRVLCGWHSVIF